MKKDVKRKPDGCWNCLYLDEGHFDDDGATKCLIVGECDFMGGKCGKWEKEFAMPRYTGKRKRRGYDECEYEG